MSAVVIDANLALALAVPLAYSAQAEARMDAWRAEGGRFVVPALWGYEVASGLRQAVAAGVLTSDEAEAAVEALWDLGVEEVPGSPERHRRALAWAARLDQRTTYDAHYLVVAEELNLPFWTADRRLASGARAAGATWVHWIGEGPG